MDDLNSLSVILVLKEREEGEVPNYDVCTTCSVKQASLQVLAHLDEVCQALGEECLATALGTIQHDCLALLHLGCTVAQLNTHPHTHSPTHTHTSTHTQTTTNTHHTHSPHKHTHTHIHTPTPTPTYHLHILLEGGHWEHEIKGQLINTPFNSTYTQR